MVLLSHASDWQVLEERYFDDSAQVVTVDQYVWSAGYIDSPIVRFHDGGFEVDEGERTLASDAAQFDPFD